jgi:hypothetical protein
LGTLIERGSIGAAPDSFMSVISIPCHQEDLRAASTAEVPTVGGQTWGASAPSFGPS